MTVDVRPADTTASLDAVPPVNPAMTPAPRWERGAGHALLDEVARMARLAGRLATRAQRQTNSGPDGSPDREGKGDQK